MEHKHPWVIGFRVSLSPPIRLTELLRLLRAYPPGRIKYWAVLDKKDAPPGQTWMEVGFENTSERRAQEIIEGLGAIAAYIIDGDEARQKQFWSYGWFF